MYDDPTGHKWVRKEVAPGYFSNVYEKDSIWDKIKNTASDAVNWANDNIVEPVADWGEQQVDNFKVGFEALTDSEKRTEAFELIDTYGSKSDKILSRVCAGTAAVAGAGIVVATAAYAAPIIAASSPLAAYAFANAETIAWSTVGVVGGGTALVSDIKDKNYGQAALDVLTMACGAYGLKSIANGYTNNYPTQEFSGADAYSGKTLNVSSEFGKVGMPVLPKNGIQNNFNAVMNEAKSGVANLKNVAKQPIKPNEVTTYKDFVDRSVVGDNLEGHEVWQHANIKANGLATERLSTDVSKNNPVIALERSQHKIINKAQRSLDVSNQAPLENIAANSNILLEAGVPQDIVNDITNRAIQHAQNNGGLK